MNSIAICIPTYNNLPSAFFIWFVEATEQWSKKYDIKVFTAAAQPVDFTRSKLINMVMNYKDKFDYIMFIDSDTYFKPNLLDKLIESNKDIVSGLYFSRVFPYNPMMYKEGKEQLEIIHDFKINDLIEVDSFGLGCCLIKTEVFKNLEIPYFKFEIEKGESLKYISEDHYFCKKLKAKGYKLYANTGVLCMHIGAEIGIEHYQHIGRLV